MRTLLTQLLGRKPTAPIQKKNPLNFLKLEDRVVPALFTFAGIAFDTDNAPSSYSFLEPGNYDGATVSAIPISAIETGVGFPDQMGFPENAAIGTFLFGGPGVKALNLPAGNVGVTARSGIEISYTGGRAVANAAGDDVVVYESANSLSEPEPFMIQAYNVNNGTWTPWFYQSAEAASLYVGNPTQGAFAHTFDLSELGVGDGEFVTKFRLVNMTSLDRMVNANGEGIVLPEDNGKTSTFLPTPGKFGPPVYGPSQLDPDPIYFGALGAVAINIANIRTTVTVTPAVAGSPATYTVLIENLGSLDAGGINPNFVLDPSFIPSSTTSSATGGASGNTTNPNGDTLTMPAGSTVTYVIEGTISPDATGPLVSTFDSGLPAGPAVDPNPSDNKFVSTENIMLEGNIVVTITPDGGTANSGDVIVYTVTVANNGPSGINGVEIASVIPPGLVGVTFTSTANGGATGNTPDGMGAIIDTANMPAGSNIVYVITGTIDPNFTGNLPFTVNTTMPPGTINPNPGDGSKTVNTTVTAAGDLFVTMMVDPSMPVSGQMVMYTIVAGNNGPSTAKASLLTDIFSAAFSGVTFTSVATPGASGNSPNGAGNLVELLTLEANSSVTYTVMAQLATNITGPVTNTATITPPMGFTDPDPTNNTATTLINVIPGADVTLSVNPLTPVASLGGKMGYEVIVTNNGPAPVMGVAIGSTIDPNILGVTFTAVGSGGASNFSSAGNGNIADSVTLPVGAKIVYTISGTVNTGITGDLTSSFTTANPPGTPDPNGDNLVTIITPTQPSPKVIYAASTGFGVTTQVFVFNADGSPRFSYQPYDTNFTRGVNVAIGDVNGDGFPDVVTGAASGGGSHVRAVDGFTGKDLFSFFAYGPVVRTGVVVGVGDVNGDGRDDIITGSDTGGGPRVRVFDIAAQGPNGVSFLDFFAFDPTMNKGIRVAGGDVNGDGFDDIIVSAGPGGPADIRIFDGPTGTFSKSFFPFEPTSTRGTYVSAADFDGDGIAEIIVGNDRGTVPTVRTFDPAQGFKQISEFFAYETNFKGGVRVGTYSDDSVSIVNPPARILTGPGLGGGPRLRKFTETGGDLGSQFLIGEFDRGGVYVG